MTKKIDWNTTYKPFGTQTVGGNRPKYQSGKEFFQKAQELQVQQEAAQELLIKAQPAMEALLKSRMASRTPLTVMRPLQYVANEMVTHYEQIEDRVNGGWMDDLDNARGSYFEDKAKILYPGVELVLKSLDPNLQEFIFLDQDNNEVALPYSAKQQIMMSTNIYEDVNKFLESYKGE